MFQRLMDILDEDKNGSIDLDELLSMVEQIYPILQECGDELETAIRDEFDDIDVDNNGFLDGKELNFLFNRICRRENFTICEQWMIDYIIELIDFDGDKRLDFEEIIANYRVVRISY